MKSKSDNKELQSNEEMKKLNDRVKEKQKEILSRLSLYFKDKRGKLPLRELYKLSGVSTSVIVDLEQKKSLPRIETLIRLSLALAPDDIDNMFKQMLENPNSDEPTTAEELLPRLLVNLGLINDHVLDAQNYIKYLIGRSDEKKLQDKQKSNEPNLEESNEA